MLLYLKSFLNDAKEYYCWPNISKKLRAEWGEQEGNRRSQSRFLGFYSTDRSHVVMPNVLGMHIVTLCDYAVDQN